MIRWSFARFCGLGLDSVIVEHGGTIDTHTGDTVFALWGVKSVGEDDSEQAVRAALAMRQVVSKPGKPTCPTLILSLFRCSLVSIPG